MVLADAIAGGLLAGIHPPPIRIQVLSIEKQCKCHKVE
jgi:hypothetical protein